MKESAVLADLGYLNVKDFKFEDNEICSDKISNQIRYLYNSIIGKKKKLDKK